MALIVHHTPGLLVASGVASERELRLTGFSGYGIIPTLLRAVATRSVEDGVTKILYNWYMRGEAQ